jgi:hypothetical protein
MDTTLANKTFVRTAIASILALAVLAGCSEDDVLAPPPSPPGGGQQPPPPPPPVQTQFGAGFQAAFVRVRDSDPLDPADGDIIPVDPTADPIDVPGR